MLVEFGVENFRSFKNMVEFSFVSSKEQQHRERLPYLSERYYFSVNPVAAVYGGNASGKSNLTKALAALQDLVHETSVKSKSLAYSPFKLDPAFLGAPTKYRLLFLEEEMLFEYRLEHTAHEITLESLTQIKSKDETLVFERRGESVVGGQVLADAFYSSDELRIPRILPLVSMLMPFANTGLEYAHDIAAPYRWLTNLLVVPPGGFTGGLISDYGAFDVPSVEHIGAGIESRKLEKIAPKDIGVSEEDVNTWASQLGEGMRGFVSLGHGRRIILKNEPSGTQLYEEKFQHASPHGLVDFKSSEESDGTLAFADLHPFFMSLARPRSTKILVIDEIDRSFHTLLIHELLRAFLATCGPETRSQLVFTTHDLLLMDPEQFRRDEIWVMEKDTDGASELISLAEYRGIRKESDLRKLYLQGRFGGTPAIKPLELVWETSDGQ